MDTYTVAQGRDNILEAIAWALACCDDASELLDSLTVGAERVA